MVNTLHRSYLKYINQIRLVRDIIEGETAIKSDRYIPKLPLQTTVDFQAMINRPSFDGFTSRLLDGLSGLAFSKPPVVDVPTKLESLMQDLDLNNANDIDMSQMIVNEILMTGRVGLLVDISNGGINEPLNGVLADKYFRPFMKIYPNESIINWRVVNNKVNLVVLSEIIERQISEFEVDEVEEFLVLALDENGYYFTRRYQVDKDGLDINTQEPTYVTQNGSRMKYIPFFSATPSEITLTPAKPPLYDMAICNLSHIKLKIEKYHILYFLQPTGYGTGISEHESRNMAIGSSQFHFYELPEARLHFLALDGSQIQPISEELETIKKTMGQIGAEFLRETSSSQESTDTVAMRTSADRATLISTIDTASRLFTLGLKELCKWLGVNPEEVTYSINTDYNLTEMSPQMMSSITAMNQVGIMSDYDVYTNLMKGEMIDEELTYQDWLDYRESSTINNQVMTNDNIK